MEMLMACSMCWSGPWSYALWERDYLRSFMGRVSGVGFRCGVLWGLLKPLARLVENLLKTC